MDADNAEQALLTKAPAQGECQLNSLDNESKGLWPRREFRLNRFRVF